MKILMLTPYLPFPLYSGGQIRTYNLLKNLAEHHEITLFSFIRNKREEKYKEELLKFCTRVETFTRRPAWSLINILLAGFTLYPFLVSIYYSLTLKKAIQKELENGDFDLIHSETFYVMPNIPQTSVPILLVEQTIEFLVYDHFVHQAVLPLRLPLAIDVAKIKFWEKFFWQKANKVIAMSQADAKVMQSEISDLDVSIVPNGVDIQFFSDLTKKKHNRKRVLFVGNFKWLQNKEAVDILINKIWPEIRKHVVDAELWIVGRYPPEDIMALHNTNGVFIHDKIADIREAYNACDVLLAPIRGPGGTRYKILEAMASRVPVVTTNRGIEGLGAEIGKDVVVQESSTKLAQATIELLKDGKKAQEFAKNGRKLIGKKYHWKIIADTLDHIYREVAHV